MLLGAAPAMALAKPAVLRAQLGAPVRIGEISSYSTQPAFTRPYRMGWELAVAHVNDLGGLNGRMLEIVSRDDGGQPENAVRAAAALLDDQKVDLLAGGTLSNVGLALSAYAQQMKKVYVAGEPLAAALTWDKGNRYTYRIRPSTFEQVAMLVETAQTLPARSWATVAPNYEYGRSAVKYFKQLMTRLHPDVRFVSEQWPALGQVDAAAVAGGLAQSAPDGIFNALFGADLLPFVREGNARGLFNRPVISMLSGEPEYLDPLGNDTPPGWIVTGYPWSTSDEPFNKSFALDYTARYHEPPCMGSVVGVAMVNAIVSGILKSGGTDSDTMASGFEDASFNTPFGICHFRPIDHQSTMGTYVGKLAKQDGRGGMVDWRYVDGAAVMPPDAEVRQLRPG